MGVRSRSKALFSSKLFTATSVASQHNAANASSIYDAKNSRISRRVLVKLAGAAVVLGLAGVAAADQGIINPASTPADNNKSNISASAIELDVTPPASTSSNDNQSNANSSDNQAVVNDTTSTATSVSSSSSSDGDTSVNVSVNGQPVAVPDNGVNQQTITTNGGKTTVTVQNNKSGAGTGSNTSHGNTNYTVRTTTNSRVISQGDSN